MKKRRHYIVSLMLTILVGSFMNPAAAAELPATTASLSGIECLNTNITISSAKVALDDVQQARWESYTSSQQALLRRTARRNAIFEGRTLNDCGLDKLAACESYTSRNISGGGSHWRVANRTTGKHWGAYQFLQTTWNEEVRLLGLSQLVNVRPDRATPLEQDAITKSHFARMGPKPWQCRGCVWSDLGPYCKQYAVSGYMQMFENGDLHTHANFAQRQRTARLLSTVYATCVCPTRLK